MLEMCQLNFKFLFQEVFDFTISFNNWQLRKDLTQFYPNDLNPKIKFTMVDKGKAINHVISYFHYILKAIKLKSSKI